MPVWGNNFEITLIPRHIISQTGVDYNGVIIGSFFLLDQQPPHPLIYKCWMRGLYHRVLVLWRGGIGQGGDGIDGGGGGVGCGGEPIKEYINNPGKRGVPPPPVVVDTNLTRNRN